MNVAIRNAKKDGRSVVIMAHRPAAIEECDLILILGDQLDADSAAFDGFDPACGDR